MRIVSLLPSATDIVVALGGQDHLVGVSHSCGTAFDPLPRLTRTWVNTHATAREIDDQVKGASAPLYELDIETLAALAPDVVVSQGLCDVCAIPTGDVEAAVRGLDSRPKLVDLTPHRLADIPVCVAQVADAIGRRVEADRLIAEWDAALARHRGRFAAQRPRIAFLDWIDPPFAAGHWVPDLIDLLGGDSVLAKPGEPSFQVDWDDVRAARPDMLFAAACGLTEDRAAQDRHPADLPITLLDGYHLFSRPSPALIDSLQVLADAVRARLDRAAA